MDQNRQRLETEPGSLKEDTNRSQTSTQYHPQANSVFTATSASQDFVPTSYPNTASDTYLTPESGSKIQSELDQINALLDAIRLNIANILRTWGRDSPQYASAAGIMQSYLVENMKRLRLVAGSERSLNEDIHAVDVSESRTREPLEIDMDERAKNVEEGIEQLMRELRLE
ncbi:hypothetical protein A1O3_05182 [Capronia epimyces CBS 606.96]|uniref:Uncharacterized protein n=1 Tax=Capronia epimyces CBS 606.96 TaxID=1182542 RepID=W9XWB2_9EURO|nr:uncharacterized protein A1O3_05182 [Capronia epimyces CBS 606.96]EXJ84513.1 hypothetical protein A1O3_05182 [Capronia epimyces CBS 606.96]